MANSDNDVELFIKLSSVRNAMERAWSNTTEAQQHLDKRDFASAIERYGVAHEDLRETTQLAKGLPNIDQTESVLESPRYRALLDFLGEVELNIVEHCSEPCAERSTSRGTFLGFPPLPKLPKPPWSNGS